MIGTLFRVVNVNLILFLLFLSGNGFRSRAFAAAYPAADGGGGTYASAAAAAGFPDSGGGASYDRQYSSVYTGESNSPSNSGNACFCFLDTEAPLSIIPYILPSHIHMKEYASDQSRI